jgi:hypothetical protein
MNMPPLPGAGRWVRFLVGPVPAVLLLTATREQAREGQPNA